MKKLLVTLTLGLAACGNADAPPAGPDTSSATEQKPPAEGYTRFSPETIEVEPGEDQTWCQWVAEPAEADIDIVDIVGEQPFPGHHAILFSTTLTEPVGTTRPCTEDDQVTMKVLGGVGGEGSASTFPTGAVVRLRKGQSLMMNTHYLNTSGKTVTGRSTLDVKFEEPSPDHNVASFFANISLKLAIEPQSEASLDVSCALPHDIKLIDFSNHLHEFGTKIHSEVIHAGGQAHDLQRDETWQVEWQFNPPRRTWSVAEPHVLKAGDTVHTRCSWRNTTTEALAFPREMCVGSGFILAEKDAFCLDGQWVE